MTEYTPTTDELLDAFVSAGPVTNIGGASEQAFHRAMAAHDAEKDAEIAAYVALTGRQSELLRGVARALKGDPPPLTIWSHHDLPELSARLCARLAEKDAEIARLVAHTIRRNCTIPSELSSPKSDATIAFVADWIENPPKWVAAPWLAAHSTPEPKEEEHG